MPPRGRMEVEGCHVSCWGLVFWKEQTIKESSMLFRPRWREPVFSESKLMFAGVFGVQLGGRSLLHKRFVLLLPHRYAWDASLKRASGFTCCWLIGKYMGEIQIVPTSLLMGTNPTKQQPHQKTFLFEARAHMKACRHCSVSVDTSY